MKTLLRYIFSVTLLAICSAVYAQLPTPEQVGLYAGKGYAITYSDLDSAKLLKQPATFLVNIDPSGTASFQMVLEGGGPPAGLGDGIFGSAGALVRFDLSGLAATGRITFKGNGLKKSISGKLSLVLISSYHTLGEVSLKLKKVGI